MAQGADMQALIGQLKEAKATNNEPMFDLIIEQMLYLATPFESVGKKRHRPSKMQPVSFRKNRRQALLDRFKLTPKG